MYPLWAMTMGGAVAPAPTLSLVATTGGAVGDIAGGYAATLTGTNFTGATGVTFGGTAATTVVVVNSTTITCVVPARPSGASSVLVTTPGGTNAANSAFEFYSPAQESLTGWHRGPYAGSPLVAVASAGTSGANGSLTTDGTAPSVGASQNGIASASYNGTTQALKTGTALSSYITATAYGVSLLVRPTATAATLTAGSSYLDPAFVSDDTNGFWQIVYTLVGGVLSATLSHYDGVTWKEISAPVPAGNYHLIHAWYDGTNLNMQVDSVAAVTPVAAGNLFSGGGAGVLRTGKNYTGAAFAGFLLEEIMLSSVSLASATTRSKRKSYVNTRYNLTL